MKRIKKYILPFIIPIIILIINFLILQIIYKKQNILSSNQILVADLKSQYVSLFNYLKNVFHGNESIFYSFDNTLGGNMIGTFTYYLSSPLNLLLIFSSTKNIPIFMFIIILIKIGLCGLFMNIYLNHKENNQFISLLFSSFYALMAYNMSYYFNIMWLDCVYLAPLVLYGIDNIIKNNNGKLYVISLSLTIISNFYIAYMVCIFTIIYFIYELLINYKIKDKKNNIKNFIICSIISIMISSIILIPTIINMKNILRSPIKESMFIKNDIFNNFLVSLSKLYVLPQSKENILSKFTPNIYFGILPLLYCITFFYGKKSNKEKYITIIIIIIFFLSFSFDFINLLWHGFTYPNGYAYRFSFLFSLFMLIISYKSICNNDKLKISKLLIYIFIILFIGMTQLNDGSNISFNYINIILTIIFLVLYYIFTHKKINRIILSIIVFIELLIQVNNSFLIPAKLGYETDYNYYIDTICNLSNKDEYRFDSPLIFGALESYTCQDKRIAGATTINNKNVYKFFYNSGFNVTYSTIVNNNNTPVIYSLMGVKKYISKNIDNNIKKIDYYFKKNKKETFYLNNNENVLPIGYIINSKYKKIFENSDTSNPFEYQNLLLKSMSGLNKNALNPYQIKKIDDNNYIVDINNDNDIYIYIDYKIPENDTYFGEFSINGNDPYTIDSYNSGVFKINNDYNNTKINIELNVPNSNIYLYYFDEEVFKEHINILNKNILDIKEINKNYLKGNINLKNDSILFLSIPYEKGWNIYIDGKKANYYKIYDAFIGIKIKKGKHNILMKYYSPGIKIGFIISILGLINFYNFIYKKRYK